MDTHRQIQSLTLNGREYIPVCWQGFGMTTDLNVFLVREDVYNRFNIGGTGQTIGMNMILNDDTIPNNIKDIIWESTQNNDGRVYRLSSLNIVPLLSIYER